MITVYHSKEPDFILGHVREVFARGGYRKVAVVDVDDMEDAYRLTNNIDDSWINNLEIKETFNLDEHGGVKGCRSTSMGDILEKDGVKYVVAAFGFQRLEG